MKSNPYYSCYRKSSNKRPKIPLYYRIFTKARESSWSRSPPSPFCRLNSFLRWENRQAVNSLTQDKVKAII